MNELIKINETDGKQSVSARELHEKLEVTDRFSRWFESMLKYGFEEKTDFTSVKFSTLVNNGATRELQDYAISIDMAKEICMIQRSEIGKKFRQYFIECEKKLVEVVKEIPYTAKVESAKLLHEIGNEYKGLSKSYKQILDAYATKELTGEFLLPLPVTEKKTYSATEIGQMLGVSSARIGRIAKEFNLKTDEYGQWYKDKARGSGKEVDTFRYYDSAIPVFKDKIV